MLAQSKPYTIAHFSLHSVEPPIIDTDPVNDIVPIGQTATFSVSASGEGTLTYQWLSDGAPLSDVPGKISGSDTNSLAIINVQPDDTTQSYSVVVSNGLSVTSVRVTLEICECFYTRSTTCWTLPACMHVGCSFSMVTYLSVSALAYTILVSES